MPKNLRSDKLLKKLSNQIEQLQILKQNSVMVSVFDHDMLVVNCGRFIKYGELNESMFNDDENSENIFHDMKIDLPKNC